MHPMYGYDYAQFPINDVILNCKHEDIKPVKISYHYQELDLIDFIPLVQFQVGVDSDWSLDFKSPLYRGPFKQTKANSHVSFYESSCLTIRKIKGTFWIYRKDAETHEGTGQIEEFPMLANYKIEFYDAEN